MAEKPTYEELEQRIKELEQEALKLNQVEVTLAEKSMYLDNILRSATEYAIATTDLDFRITYYNPLAEKLFGYTAAEVIGKTVQEIHTKEQVASERFEKAIEKIHTHGEYRYQVVQEGSNGPCYLNSRVSGIYNPTDELVGFALFSRDVTRQLNAEKALRESEEKYRQLTESMKDVVVRISSTGKVLYASPTIKEFGGYDPENEIGNDVSKYFQNETDLIRATELLSKVSITHQSGDFEFLFKPKNKDPFPVEHTYLPILKNDKVAEIQLVLRDVTERKQAEETLRDSEKKLKTILDTTTDVAALVETSGILLVVNDALAKSLGRKKDELIGKSAFEFLSSEVAEKRMAIIHKMVASKKPVQWEDEHAGKCFANSTYPILDNNGNVKQIALFAKDITARKKTNDQLQLQTLVLDQIEDHVTITDLTGDIIYVNESQERSLGLTKDECIGQTTKIYGDDLARGATQEEIVRNTLKNGSWRGEVVNYANDGQDIIMDCRTQVIHDNEGNPIYLCGIATNITERKLSEQALQESEETARLLMNATTEIAMLVDPEGNIVAANESAAKRFNLTPEELVGKGAFDLLLPEVRERRQKVFRQFLVDKKPIRLEDENNGSHFDNSVYPLLDKDGNIRLVAMFAQDITARKLSEQALRDSEERLQQSQKMESIGTLAGGIAHDFNNILFPVVGHSEMLLEDIPQDSPLRNHIEEIHSGALRAKDLIKQILAFSRQDSIEIKLIKIQPIVKEALKLIRSTIPTSIEIKQYIMKDCGVIKADPTQIHQIVMNLATNAYHAMEDAGGTLQIGLKEIAFGEQDVINQEMEPGLYACLTVGDTGNGIGKDVRAKIFDPFFTTKELGKGTGMGLSVVHGIVKKAGGSIQVDSQPDKGTKFHVYLPIVKSISGQQVIKTTGTNQGGTEQILLVDDEEAIVTVEKEMLERLGYQVVSRTSSVEALEAFRGNPDKFDVVITDMNMPNMSGDRLATELVKIRPDIPVVLCTGFSETMPEEKAAAMGIKKFLMKPITIKDLSKMIRGVLDNT